MASRSATDEAHRLDPAFHSTADAPALAADSDARPIRARRRDGVARLVWVVLALVVLAALAYFLWQKNQSREAIPPVASAPAEVAPPAADAAPAMLMTVLPLLPHDLSPCNLQQNDSILTVRQFTAQPRALGEARR